LVNTLREYKKIYLAIDDRTVTLAGASIPGAISAEKQLLTRVDAVVCVSNSLKRVLFSRLASEKSIPIRVVSNGYDEKLFDPTLKRPRPLAFAAVPRSTRIVLVAGHISDRIDWEGVDAALQLRPAWSWVFVGPIDHAVKREIDALSSRHGKHRLVVLPAAKHSEIPDYIAHSDICAIPYRLNEFTRASSPLKALEYLAMGSPVLSTRVPALAPYSDGIEWVEEANGESYAMAIDRLGAHGQRDHAVNARRHLVRHESWTEKTKQLQDLVGGLALGDQH